MKEKVLNKLIAAVLTLCMLFANCTMLFNTSVAANGQALVINHTHTPEQTVSNWDDIIRSFPSVAYKMNGVIQQKWSFYDIRETGKYENLNCIRSGASQDWTYYKHDLYHLKEECPEVFDELFKAEGMTDEEAYRNYLHVLWEAENFYLFSDSDTNEDKTRKFNEYNQFIGASSTPYSVDDMAQVQLYLIHGGGATAPEKLENLNKNEALVKALQNEMLLDFVVQTYPRNSDPTTIYNYTWNNYYGRYDYVPESQAVNDYAKKIVDKFTSIENSNGYNPENINKYFNTNPERVKVTLRETADTDPTDNVSGSFFVSNKFNADVSAVRVYINGNETTNYTMLNANNQDITAGCKNEFKNNAKTNEYEFKIQSELLADGDNTVRIELDIDYGYIIHATLFEPDNKNLIRQADGTYKGCQYVININKDHETETVRAQGDTSAKKFDLALTKQISKIEVENSNGDVSYSIVNRLLGIDDEALASGKSTNARYAMAKNAVYIEPGKKVVYTIKVYNEGEIDGFAEEIRDYLPEGLSLAENSEINTSNGWEIVDGNNRIIRTTKLSSNGNPQSSNILKAFNKKMKDENIQEVELECLVDANVENRSYLDNRAEITHYGYYLNGEFVNANENGIDRDSVQDSAFTNAEINRADEDALDRLIEDIRVRIRNNTQYNPSNDDKNKISYQDDDDIDRLYVKFDARILDLALRKWITNVDGTDYDRAPAQYEEYVTTENLGTVNQWLITKLHTLEYDNPKEAIELNQGSIVTYKIAIFNEGTTGAYAEEVTDFLPKGLEFIEDNQTNIDNGWVATKNEDGTTTVRTTKYSKENGTGPKNNEIVFPLEAYTKHALGQDTSDEYRAHKTLEIVCRVSEDAEDEKYLTNRAEITKYGYFSKDKREFYYAEEEGVDRDSEQDTIKDDLNLDNWYIENYVKVYNPDTPQTFFPGVQDDDDYETVKVKIKNQPTEYSLQIKKVSAEDKTKTIEGAKFAVKDLASSEDAKETEATGADGITKVLDKVTIDEEGKDNYIITETYVPDPYSPYKGEIKLEVGKQLVNHQYVLDKDNTKVTGENVELDITGNIITITVPNPEREFDLSLRKFITAVNDKAVEGEESREPVVDLSTLINGDPKKNGEKTATYTHTKEPKLVNPKDIVEYTLRIYNEGEVDGYASRIIDDVPAGVTMVAPEYDEEGKPSNKNAEYRWTMYKELSDADKENEENNSKSVIKYEDKYYIETEKAEEAVIISTDYLSMENGERLATEEDTENPNLLKAFNGEELDYRDIKVEFKVNIANDNKTIITNYAQISENHGKDGNPIIDRDSTPNEWIGDEDDQDIEKIRVNWFDLALYKWVSSTIVTEDGKTKEYASGHTQDDKEKIVNVTVAKDKLNKTVVKFKWTIKVENQSPIPGYATELKDHIPAGLKFVEEDNKEFGWKLQKDGTITTDYLKNTLLAPAGMEGNTAEVTVILTWVNGENNLGAKVNYAEISEDFNEYGAPDIDSTPNNFTGKPIEDDEDQDEVRLNIKTGNGIITEYVIIATAFIAIIAAGAITVKKCVLDKEF